MSQQPVTCVFCNRTDMPMVVRSRFTECVICTDCIAQCTAMMADQIRVMDADIRASKAKQSQQ